MLQVLPMISTVFIVISAVLVAIGWYLVKQGKIEAHKKVMWVAAVFALSFFIIYMSRTIFIGNMAFGGPENIRVYYQVFLIFHIMLATTGGVMGLISLYSGYKNKLVQHKRIGPWTSIIWFLTAITGVAVYLLLFVIYPGGETSSLFKTIFGF